MKRFFSGNEVIGTSKTRASDLVSATREDSGVKTILFLLRALRWIIPPAGRLWHLYRRYQALATRDLNTGLLNRLGIRQTLEAEVTLLLRSGPRVGVSMLFVDLDNFKLANDTLGHLGGDMMIQLVTEHLLRIFRPTEVCRWGGDEFAVLLPNTSERLARKKAEALLDALRMDSRLYFRAGDWETVRISASIGIVTDLVLLPAANGKVVAPPDTEGLYVRLETRAPVAMQMAKELGKDQICVLPSQTQIIPFIQKERK